MAVAVSPVKVTGFNVQPLTLTTAESLALSPEAHGFVHVKDASGDVTLTLPDTTGLAPRTAFALSRNDANGVTIARENASDTINGEEADFGLPNGSSIIVAYIGDGDWQIY